MDKKILINTPSPYIAKDYPTNNKRILFWDVMSLFRFICFIISANKQTVRQKHIYSKYVSMYVHTNSNLNIITSLYLSIHPVISPLNINDNYCVTGT